MCVLLGLDAMVNLVSFLPGVVFPLNGLCQAQGVLIQTFTLAAIIWTGLIAGVSLTAVIKQVVHQINIVRYLVGVLTFSSFTAVIAFSWHDTELYSGTAGAWCWFPTVLYGEKFGLYYGIAWAIIILCNFTYCYIWSLTRHNVGSSYEIWKLKYYPIVLLVTFIPVTLSRILESWVKLPLEYRLWAAVFVRLLGFFNSLVYGYTNKIRQRSEHTHIELNKL